MKISTDQIWTTTEIMRDLFSMPNRLIFNMPERERYNHIHIYLYQLVKEGEATSVGKLEVNKQECYGFNFQDELYIVPIKFLLEDGTEKESIASSGKKVISL
ncbi:hypothetical protein [Sporohalobacter salinus]|uniref:hypothetical protein n=1 Tax=Sporohalobacter salinus TaxID=1494606 RepID=UPI00196023D3|nr:hypothetical protein [Sporohalobacter salinus]MBM7624390.1 hypothetical protein [Sporohalobacter salinus]